MKKARAFLAQAGVEHQFIDYRADGLNQELLAHFVAELECAVSAERSRLYQNDVAHYGLVVFHFRFDSHWRFLAQHPLEFRY